MSSIIYFSFTLFKWTLLNCCFLAASTTNLNVASSSEVAGKPGLHTIHQLLKRADVQVRKLALPVLLHPCDEQADRRRIARMLHHFREGAVVMRHTDAHRHVENFFAKFDHSLHETGAAGDHDARRQKLLVAAATKLRLYE